MNDPAKCDKCGGRSASKAYEEPHEEPCPDCCQPGPDLAKAREIAADYCGGGLLSEGQAELLAKRIEVELIIARKEGMMEAAKIVDSHGDFGEDRIRDIADEIRKKAG